MRIMLFGLMSRFLVMMSFSRWCIILSVVMMFIW